jgi:tetratricopeptide (TPR) repeat protein
MLAHMLPWQPLLWTHWIWVWLVLAGACGGGTEDKSGPGEVHRTAGGAPVIALHGSNADKLDPEPAASPDKHTDEHKKARMRGHKLMNNGKYAEAAAAFKEALAVRADDARILSELSWAAFKAGDSQAAVDAAERSIALTGNPELKAASLYNLGRVKEAQGDKDAAKRAYSQSLGLRSNRTVQQRFNELGGELPKESYAPAPLFGPFASLTEYCATLRGPMECNPNASRITVRAVVAAMAKPPAPLREMRFFGYRDKDGTPRDNLAIKTVSGWFVKDSFEQVVNRRDARIDEISFRHGRILIRHSATQGRFASEREKLLTVCGLGNSKTVSCTPSISLEWAFQGIGGDSKSDQEELPLQYTHKLAAELQSATLLVIKPRDTESERAVAVGEHTLLFP